MHPVLQYYLVKRVFCFIDEWLFYIFLLYLFERKYYRILIGTTMIGALLILTSYKNLEIIEADFTRIFINEKENFKQYTLWPIV